MASKRKSPRARPKQPPATKAQSATPKNQIDSLLSEVEGLRRELKEARDQQTATNEILGVIASSPTDIQPVLTAIAENATRVCGADDALIWRVEGNLLRLMAHYGPIQTVHDVGETDTVDRNSVIQRAVVDREVIHVHDLLTAEADFPDARTRGIRMGVRTALAAPLLRERMFLSA
jgi:hypothetical protein